MSTSKQTIQRLFTANLHLWWARLVQFELHWGGNWHLEFQGVTTIKSINLTSVRQTVVAPFTGYHIRLVPWRALWVSLFALFELHPSCNPVLGGLLNSSMSDHPMLAKDLIPSTSSLRLLPRWAKDDRRAVG